MADATITGLGHIATPIASTDQIPLQRGTGNGYMTVSDITSYLSSYTFSTFTITALTVTTVAGGSATFSGTLGVTGLSTLGSLSVTGSSSLATLSTSGLATLNSLSVLGAAAVAGVLTVGNLAAGTTVASTPADTDSSNKAATTQFVKNYAPSAKIQTLSASIASGAIQISTFDTYLDFRSATATSGGVTSIYVPAHLITIPAAANFGYGGSGPMRIYVLILNVSGSIYYGVTSGGVNLDESTLVTTQELTNLSGSRGVIYTSAGPVSTPSPFRVVGYVDATWGSNTWTSISSVQGMGGQACTALGSLGYGQTWHTYTTGGGDPRQNGVSYYNLSGKPIFVAISFSQSSATASTLYVGGTLVANCNQSNVVGGQQMCAIVPPGVSYTAGFGSNGYSVWAELR